jgi:sialic acid synthase SpsE
MLDKTIEFDGNTINSSSSPFVIAEIGSNFNQDIDVAKKLIRVAKDSNANAVKFQLFNSEELYPKKDGLYDIFKSVELNPDWIPELKSYSDDLNISFMASCFDKKSVDVIEQNNILAHKIASSETTNLNLLAYLASKNKPLFISTGMCNFIDIEEALNVCIETGNTQVCLLQCTAQYPLDISNANLCVIPEFINRYKCNVGFSDHSTSNVQAITSVGLGAKVFEKHITLDKTSKGPDHFYAAEPEEFKNYVLQIHEAFDSLGSHTKELTKNEKKEGRRDGLYYSNDLEKGDTLSKSKVIVKRPALGIRSRYFDVVAQAKIKRNVTKDEPINWEDLEF